jgi:polysaccharide chain length determinant protein (PEP-CTERM system associated)
MNSSPVGRGRTAPPADSFDDSNDDSFDFASLRHYLHAPLRRPWLVVVPWAVVFALSIVALFVLPKRYKSSTLILIESDRVPESFVTKVATEDRSQRVDAIRAEILSRTRLERVEKDTNPYPGISSTRQAVDLLRWRTFVNWSGSDGFTIEFVHEDPLKAQEVVNRLATLFIEETIKSRETQVEDAVDFIVTQVGDAGKQLEVKEEALRLFKEKRMGRLPEQLQSNLATMGMLQQELRGVEESLLFAMERQATLNRAAQQGAGTPVSVITELTELQRQLASMRGRYTDEHPDVQNLKARVERLQGRVAERGEAQSPADASSLGAREQLEAANAEIARLQKKRNDLEGRIASLRGRVEDTPRTEQELVTLTRDYQKLSENYAALLAKQLDAQMAGRLERRWRGDRFRVLDPADLPEKPYFPKPSLILGLGVLCGLMLGLGAALVAEHLDPTVKDVADLHNLREYTVLACIPHMPGPGETPTR